MRALAEAARVMTPAVSVIQASPEEVPARRQSSNTTRITRIIAGIRTDDAVFLASVLTIDSLNAALIAEGQQPVTSLALRILSKTPAWEYLACGMKCRFGTTALGVSTDNCSSTCGDGMRAIIEQCDDGNKQAGDGCDASCNIEDVDDFYGYWNCWETALGQLSSADPGSDVGGDNATEVIGASSPLLFMAYGTSEAASVLDDRLCMASVCEKTERVSVEQAKGTAQVLTTAVATTIAAVTTSVVVSSVASSIAGTTGGAAGGAAGGAGAGAGAGVGAGESAVGAVGAGLGPLFALVDQVQFMAVVGRVGGNNASESNSAFSSGMEWINLSPPVPLFSAIPSDNSSASERRASEVKAKTSDGCKYNVMLLFAEKILICVALLVFIFLLRSLCCWIYMRHYPQEPKPPDMSWPNWEG